MSQDNLHDNYTQLSGLIKLVSTSWCNGSQLWGSHSILNSITSSEIGVHLGSSQFRISFAWGMCWDWSLVLHDEHNVTRHHNWHPSASLLVPAPAYHLLATLAADSVLTPVKQTSIAPSIRQLLKATKCEEDFLFGDKKNISYDNGLILEAGKFLLDSLLFMPCPQLWSWLDVPNVEFPDSESLLQGVWAGDICCICSLNVRNATQSHVMVTPMKYKAAHSLSLSTSDLFSSVEISFIFLNNKSTFYVPRRKLVFQIYQTLELNSSGLSSPGAPFYQQFYIQIVFYFCSHSVESLTTKAWRMNKIIKFWIILSCSIRPWPGWARSFIRGLNILYPAFYIKTELHNINTMREFYMEVTYLFAHPAEVIVWKIV